MITSLLNTYFYGLVILTYLIILILVLGYVNLFEIIGGLKIISLLKTPIKGIGFFNTAGEFPKNKMILHLKKFILKVNDLILIPVTEKSLFILEKISYKMSEAELHTENVTTHDLSEAFTILSLLLRKSVEGAPQIVFSAMLALIVVIYFILTMQ